MVNSLRAMQDQPITLKFTECALTLQDSTRPQECVGDNPDVGISLQRDRSYFLIIIPTSAFDHDMIYVLSHRISAESSCFNIISKKAVVQAATIQLALSRTIITHSVDR